MINVEALELIKEFEGIRLTAYPDPGSKNGLPWTIGYGHTKGVKRGDKITKAQAEAFLIEDLEKSEAVIKKYVKVYLNENQHGALVSLIHNIGEKQFAKSSVLRYINEGRLDEVPGRMALYRMNDGKVMAGLVRRRIAEGALWMKPAPDGLANSPNEQMHDDREEAQGLPAEPAKVNKPWDWGVFGVIITTLAGLSDEFKKLIGDVTSALGVPPLYILAALVIGFGAWTVYNKWKSN